MPKQSKFENVDLFASLNAVMKQNTGFYQSDLDIDKEIIAKAAARDRKSTRLNSSHRSQSRMPSSA